MFVLLNQSKQIQNQLARLHWASAADTTWSDGLPTFYHLHGSQVNLDVVAIEIGVHLLQMTSTFRLRRTTNHIATLPLSKTRQPSGHKQVLMAISWYILISSCMYRYLQGHAGYSAWNESAGSLVLHITVTRSRDAGPYTYWHKVFRGLGKNKITYIQGLCVWTLPSERASVQLVNCRRLKIVHYNRSSCTSTMFLLDVNYFTDN